MLQLYCFASIYVEGIAGGNVPSRRF